MMPAREVLWYHLSKEVPMILALPIALIGLGVILCLNRMAR